MIITVTLNPALDKTVEINDFSINRVNRISASRIDAGGKGINVSKVIAVLGGASTAVGVLAGNTGQFIQNYLRDLGIQNDFLFVAGETRTNLKIVDQKNQQNTDINEPGPGITPNELDSVRYKLMAGLNEQSVVVFSGSVPHNVSKDVYAQWIGLAKEKGAKTILDADGELLALGIQAQPFLVKPNIHELEQLVGRSIQTIEEIKATAMELIQKYQLGIMVVSLGEQGALFIQRDQALWVHGMKVEVKSTVGAGDSMAASLAISLEQDHSLVEAASMAVAVGTANVMTSGTEPATLDMILELKKRVTWEWL